MAVSVSYEPRSFSGDWTPARKNLLVDPVPTPASLLVSKWLGNSSHSVTVNDGGTVTITKTGAGANLYLYTPRLEGAYVIGDQISTQLSVIGGSGYTHCVIQFYNTATDEVLATSAPTPVEFARSVKASLSTTLAVNVPESGGTQGIVVRIFASDAAGVAATVSAGGTLGVAQPIVERGLTTPASFFWAETADSNLARYSWTGVEHSSSSLQEVRQPTTAPVGPWEPQAVNLVTNPSFEASAGSVEVRRNLAPNPFAVNGGTAFAAIPGTGGAATGAYQIGSFTGFPSNSVYTVTWTTASTAGGGVQLPAFAATPATPYAISFYHGVLSSKTPLSVFVDWYNGSSVFISTTTVSGFSSSAIAARAQAVATAPAGAASGVVRFEVTGAGVWTATEWLRVSGVLVEANTTAYGTFFGGSTATGDADLTAAWSGTANASASTISGVSVYDATVATAAVPISSALWAATRSKSLRLIPTGSNDSYASPGGDVGGMRLGMAASGTYTILGTVRLSAAQTGTLSANARRIVLQYRVGTGAYTTVASTAAPNAAGTAALRLLVTLPAGVTEAFVRIYNGAPSGGGDVWWDSFAVIPGDYPGAYFDGSFSDGDTSGYAWNGTPDASSSTLSTRAYALATQDRPDAASGYTVRLDATATSPTDSTAATPEFTATVPMGQLRERYRQRGRGMALRDDDGRGMIQGYMDGFTSTAEDASVTAISPLSALVARVELPAIGQMTFSDFMVYLIGLVDPSIPIQFQSEVEGFGQGAGPYVCRSASTDTAWNILNDECMMRGIECVMYDGTVTFRMVRGGVIVYDDLVEQARSYTGPSPATYVEVTYNQGRQLGFIGATPAESYTEQFWPPRRQDDIPREEQESVISIGSGESIQFDIRLDGVASLTSLSQPIAVDWGGVIPLSQSYYYLMDKDGNLVTAAWWNANGGAMRADIIDNGDGVRVTAQAPASELAPFQFAEPSYYPQPGSPIVLPTYGIHLQGNGAIFNPVTELFHTGANPHEVVQEIGATIEINGLNDANTARGIIQPVLAEYSAPTQNVSGSFSRAEMMDLVIDPYHGFPGWRYLGPPTTATDRERLEWYNDRLFLALIGSRFRNGDAFYRITHVEFSEDNISFDAKADTTSDDIENMLAAAGMTYGDLETALGDLTWEEWEAMPLFLGWGDPYGTGVYGEGVYGT